MVRLSRFLSLFLVGLFMAGCATISVQHDYDEQARFDGYHTFSWLASQNTQDVPGPYRDDGLLDKRIKRAVSNTLETQGYTEQPDGTPDFYVVYRVGLEEKTRTVYYDSGYGYGYPYRGYSYRYSVRRSFFGYRGYGYPYGGYGYDNHRTTTTYHEGTLVIDIIDAKTNEQVWRGAAVSTIGDPTYDAQEIQKAVEKILEEFPPSSYPPEPFPDRQDVVAVP